MRLRAARQLFAHGAVVRHVRFCAEAAGCSASAAADNAPAVPRGSLQDVAARRRADLHFDFILDPANLEKIRRNAEGRKQACSIDAVHSAWAGVRSHIASSRAGDPRTLSAKWDELYAEAGRLPNVTHRSVPADGNRVAEVFGDRPAALRGGKVKTLEELCRRSRTLRTDVTHACGDRSYVLLAPVARLEQALLDYALDYVLAADPDFRLIGVPDVLDAHVVEACGLGERAAAGLSYHVGAEPGAVLSGTGEAGVAAYLRGSVFDYDELPLKLLTVSRCYRPEAHGGADEQWLYRVHEFSKVEMFTVTADEPLDGDADTPTSDQCLSDLIAAQVSLYTSLGLHFRLVEMCAAELGAAAARKFDVEAWMEGRRMWGEISSASSCTDYQSRRLGAYYRHPATGRLRPVHTCNATAAAGCRLLIALIETYQTRRGPIDVPAVLRPYLSDEPGPTFDRCVLKMATKEIRTKF